MPHSFKTHLVRWAAWRPRGAHATRPRELARVPRARADWRYRHVTRTTPADPRCSVCGISIKAKTKVLWIRKYCLSYIDIDIPPEVLKRCNLDDEILGFCNRALLEGRKPEQWSIMNIIPIPKTGDLSKGNNYRGISLSSLVAKTYNRMILNRIRPAIEPHLRINQNGFRPGRTTTSQILALRRLIEGIKDKNLSAQP